MDKKQLSIIVAIVAVVIIAAAAAVVLMKDNGDKTPEPAVQDIELESGKDITAALISGASEEFSTVNIIIASDSSKITQTIKADAVSVLKKNNTALTISTKSGASIALDAATVKALPSSDLVVSLDTSTSAAEIEKGLGADSGATEIISASVGNVSKLGGNATVKAPYTLKSGENSKDIEIWYTYTDDKGVKQYEEYPATYSNGFVTFKTTHFSNFYVAFTTLEEAGYKAPKSLDISDVAQIYGNANGDYTIDSRDLAVLREIIANNDYTVDKYPFADANQDGKIDSKDIELVKKIIKRESTTVYYLNYFGEAQSIAFPLVNNKIAVTYWQQAEAVSILGHWNEVVVANESVYTNKANQYDLSNVKAHYGTTGSSKITEEGVSMMVEQGVNLIIATPSAVVKETADKLAADRGVNVVYLWYAGDYCASTILTLGILMDSEDKGTAYVQYCDNVKSTITSRLSTLGDDLPSILITMMYANEESYYSKNGGVSVLAGANEGAYTLLKILGKVYGQTDGLDTWGKAYKDIEWLMANEFDYIIDLEESTGFMITNVEGAKFYTQDQYNARFEASFKYYEKTSAYANGNFLGSTYVFGGFSGYSMLLMAAYMIYPELFTLEEAQSSLQKWFDEFTVCKIDVTKEGGYYYTGDNYVTNYMKNREAIVVDKSLTTPADTLLRVFGNVNGDNYINSEDVALLSKIILGKADQTYYADVNQDGYIDSNDLAALELLINGKETVLYYQNYALEICSVNVPVENIDVVYYQVLDAVITLGYFDKVVGVDTTATDRANLYPGINEKYALGSYKDLNSIVESILASGSKVVVTGSKAYYMNGIEEKLPEGYSVIRLCNAAGGTDIMWHVLTLGYILGCQDAANEYITFFNDITSLIEERTANVDAINAVGIYFNGSDYSVLAKTSGVYESIILAGAKNTAEGLYEETGNMYYNLSDAEWLLQKSEEGALDYLVLTVGKSGYGNSRSTQEAFNEYYQAQVLKYGMEVIPAYADGNTVAICYNLVNGISLSVGTMWLATLFYADQFSDIDPYDYLQTWYDKFTLLDIDVREVGAWVDVKQTPEPEYTGTSNLWVYGNVNGDDYIDQKDVDLLKKILTGAASEVYVQIYDGYNATGNETYLSFADANGDGKLTYADVEYIEDLIAYQERYTAAVNTGSLASFTEKFTVYYNDVDNVKSEVTLPVNTMVSIYFSNSEIVRLLGATDRVVAVDQTTLNKANMLPEFQKFKGDKDHIVDRFSPNSEQVLSIAADVYFTGSRGTYGPNLEKEVGAVTQIVRLPAWEDNNQMAATLTLGYILGATNMAYTYIDWANKYINLVSDRLAENAHDVQTVIVPKGRNASLEGNGLGSGQYEISELAGGNNLAKLLPATNEYPAFTQEWALTANPDYIILSGYCGYENSNIQAKVFDVLTTAYQTYAHTAAADNGRIYFISNEIFTGPSAYIAMMYIATWMYPEIFADIDPQAVFQEYLDTFCPQMASYDLESTILQHVCGPSATLETADLKVFGNVDGDEDIDSNDLILINYYIAAGLTADLCPMADANQDGKIDEADADVVSKIIAGESTVVYHVNYHDADGNGTMDLEIVSTTYPVSSAIMTGSANSFMLTYMLGIIDEIKGASYGSTNDKALFGDNYLNESKVVKLGKSSSSITFEDGKAGSSNVIAEQNVTAVISDWNRTYITNETAFETAGVDVIRVAAASTDRNVYTHSILLLGFLFQKEDVAKELVAYYNNVLDEVNAALDTLSDDQKVKAVASSMTGYLSSGESDYQAVLNAAGASFGLEGFDFGSSASIKVVDNLGVYDTSKYNFDYIVQIRTALTYENLATETINKNWTTYTDAFSLWEHAADGQVLLSGVIPVPLRIAYAAYAMYGNVCEDLSLDWANGLHQDFVDEFYAGSFDVTEHTFVMTAALEA